MQWDNNPQKPSHEGGIQVSESKLDVGRNLTGRDSISHSTTNVFHSDRRLTLSLILLLGIVLVGLVVALLVALSKLEFDSSPEARTPAFSPTLIATGGVPTDSRSGITRYLLQGRVVMGSQSLPGVQVHLIDPKGI